MEILNAKIRSVTLGHEGSGILTFGLALEIGVGNYCVYGGRALNFYDKQKGKRVFSAKSMECLTEIMRVVGVRRWEDLTGKYIRVQTDGWGSTISIIGNIMEEKWFNIEKFFGQDN